METIAENLENVKNEIRSACEKSGRDYSEIQLVAVSKRKPASDILTAYNLGHTDFGENKPQELRDKAKELQGNDIHWHFIGHLQENKIKYVVPVATLIHSVSSFKLAVAINEWIEKKMPGKKIDALLELKTAPEESKHGLIADAFFQQQNEWSDLKNIRFKGVMTMATNTDDENEIRRCFREARRFYEKLLETEFINGTDNYLSMGMSDDYSLAIEEGATILRIGSKIFGQRI